MAANDINDRVKTRPRQSSLVGGAIHMAYILQEVSMMGSAQTCRVAGLLVVIISSIAVAKDPVTPPASPADVFEQRILPIFRSEKPSSCVQCHLAAVDLKNYILPSAEKTFASLREQGLIDLATPRKSRILELIARGERDVDKGARLIHKATRQAEYDAFAAWIEACCADDRLRTLPVQNPDELAGPQKSNAVIRHARKSRVLDSFERNIWSQRMRCFPCHTPEEIDPSNPKHQAAVKTQKKLEEDYPADVLLGLRIFKKTPEETLQSLIENSKSTPAGQLPLINLKEPAKSLIVLKPTSKLPLKLPDGTFAAPSSVEPITHMGGLKMHPDDQTYKLFVAWIQDYAKVVGNVYATPADLPADNWQATQHVLRMTDTPETWPVGTAVQLFIYRSKLDNESWEPKPFAFTQGTVTPRGIVNGTLILLGPIATAETGGASRASVPLSGGRFLIKVYVDAQHRLADDPSLLLGPAEFSGQAILNRPRWREGFRQAASVSAKSLVK